MPLTDRIPDRLSQQAERATLWLTHAVERLSDADRFVAADQTPYELIHQSGLLSVRRYLPLSEDEIEIGGERVPVRRKPHRVPVVLVPPLAADPLNFDLLPQRSLVRYLLAQGYKVYLVDFGSPERDHSAYGLSHYTTQLLPEALTAVRRHARLKSLSLLGYCMGGLFCLIYAGWSHDRQIKNIVTIASPIDAHQAGVAGQLLAAMRGPIKLVRRYTGFRIHKLDPARLNVPGWVSSLAFKLTNPLGTLTSYVDLLMNLWDRDYVVQHQTMAAWFNDMHAYPGGIVQDFVVRVGMDNALSKGRVPLGKDQEALLDRIDASLLAIAGTSDKIVTVEAARKVMDIVASADKRFALAPGGHAGVFAGSKAPATTWALAADWLRTRSA
ncbi:alpha/beta fold hydrolase [Stagnimonas aquatica]|uniref:Alpha/beta fold hydrolase n=1 Tax=Stagnimonas aquatica TaxID=2689987 RepID=A0A3N0VL64_9GAMM|nr:alpha/beta fold hydrolase [Stagnimonas aquatica]ROH93512.1 alpha/beta fold hydrolase [Stagnimonas aquatica]